MKFNYSQSRLLQSLVATCTLAVLATGCGSGANLPTATALNSNSLTSAATEDISTAAIQDFFSVLSDGTTDNKTQPADLKKRWHNFKSQNPDMAAKMEALKNLTPAERQAKLKELHPQGLRPTFDKTQALGQHPGFAPGQRPAFGAGHPPMPAEMAAKMQEFKNMTPEERKAKMQEFGQKQAEQFKAAHPEMAAKMEEFKNMTSEERKAKMQTFQKAHPDAKSPQGKPRAGAPFHRGFSGPMGPRPTAAQK